MITGVTGAGGIWPAVQTVQNGEITDTPGTAMPQVSGAEEPKAVEVEISEVAMMMGESPSGGHQVFATKEEDGGWLVLAPFDQSPTLGGEDRPLSPTNVPVRKVLDAYAKAAGETNKG